MSPRTKHYPEAVDLYVGRRMRLRRAQLGLSQGALANKLGISFQAVQKYESGDNRISASRLYDIAQALDAPLMFFFEGCPYGIIADNLNRVGAPISETFDRPEVMSLIRGYLGIRDTDLRALVLRIVNRLGKRGEDDKQERAAD